jgi:hypothetical protein
LPIGNGETGQDGSGGVSGSSEAAPASPADGARPAAGDDPVGEVLLGWAAAALGAWAVYRFAPESAAPFAAALVWIGVAVGLHLARGRSLEAAGIAFLRPLRSLGRTALYAGVFLPLYAAGFLAWGAARGAAVGTWRFPGADIFAATFLFELARAGLPEEIFFRGFVQPRLAALPGGRRGLRVLFVPLTRASVLAAALFAATHIAFEAQLFTVAAAARLLTFFPGLLFGALREETGDVVAPALFHALCNATLDAMQRGLR